MEIIPNLHPIFVHFTVALFAVSTALFLISLFLQEGQLKLHCLLVARWNLWMAALISLLTLYTGWDAYNTVAHDDPSHIAMTDHRNWALSTMALYFALSLWSVWQHYRKKIVGIYFILLLVLASTLLASTAWRGGELVYRYGLGVMSLPKVELEIKDTQGDGHNHSHGEEKLDSESSSSSQSETLLGVGSSKSHDGHDHKH